MGVLLLACAPEKAPGPAGTGDTSPADTSPMGTGAACSVDGDSVTFACGLVVSSVAEGTLRLRHGVPRDSWAVLPAEEAAPPSVVTTDGSTVTVAIPGLRGEVQADCRVTVTDNEAVVLYDEPVRGGRYTCRNTDAYDPDAGGWVPDADPLYPCVPFTLSLREGVAAGVFVDIPWTSAWDVGATTADRLSITMTTDTFDTYVFAGPAPADVVARYTALTARASIPPRWILGFHQSRVPGLGRAGGPPRRGRRTRGIDR